MKKTGLEFKCENCGGTFRQPPSRGTRANRFCSRKCREEWDRLHPESRWRKRQEFKCLACGKPFKRRPLRGVKFCSSACYHEYQGRAIRAADPNCKRCGNALSRAHLSKAGRSGLCLDCWRKYAEEEGLCYKPAPKGWAYKFEKCTRCGGTDSDHHGHGVCDRCHAKEGRRKSKGTWGKVCEVCGEERTIAACHIIPKRLGGPPEGWNILFLCALHHGGLDEDELRDEEWGKIESKLRAAFERMPLKGVKFGRRGLPWALRRFVPAAGLSPEMMVTGQLNV